MCFNVPLLFFLHILCLSGAEESVSGTRVWGRVPATQKKKEGKITSLRNSSKDSPSALPEDVNSQGFSSALCSTPMSSVASLHGMAVPLLSGSLQWCYMSAFPPWLD